MAKVKKQIMVDGKLDEPVTLKYGQGKRKVRSLDELMGYTKNPYSSLTVDQYEEKLKLTFLVYFKDVLITKRKYKLRQCVFTQKTTFF